MSDNFWAEINRQLEELKTAKSADDVVRIIGPKPGLMDPSAGAFFEGSGGDNTVWDSLDDAGWKTVWSKAGYYWAMKAPDGSHITYIEGDIYPVLKQAI